MYINCNFILLYRILSSTFLDSGDLSDHALQETKNMFSVKASKKMVQQHIFKQLGKVVALIFALHKHVNLTLFEAKLWATRWTRVYYKDSHQVFSTNDCHLIDISVSTMERLPAVKV